MTGREHFLAIMNRNASHSGFWHGNPNPASQEKLFGALGVQDDFAFGLKLGSDCRWVMPNEWGIYRHPEGKPMFNPMGGKAKRAHGDAGVFAECEDVAEVEAYEWPDEKYIDLGPTIAEINRSVEAGQAVLSGIWASFFHMVSYFFGMENYFVKMYTDPAVVDAVTEHVVDFYLRVNERLFAQVGDRIDMCFFGNDFGTQRDMIISPEAFERFVMPSFVKLTDQAHRFGLKVLLHSCGSIYRIIPHLIDAGVDALHPIQAQAVNMDANTLARDFGGRIVFVGGVDTQQLLPTGTPQQVRDEVRRLRDLFGPNYVVSPSHESILPDVPIENVLAMAEAAHE